MGGGDGAGLGGVIVGVCVCVMHGFLSQLVPTYVSSFASKLYAFFLARG